MTRRRRKWRMLVCCTRRHGPQHTTTHNKTTSIGEQPHAKFHLLTKIMIVDGPAAATVTSSPIDPAIADVTTPTQRNKRIHGSTNLRCCCCHVKNRIVCCMWLVQNVDKSDYTTNWGGAIHPHIGETPMHRAWTGDCRLFASTGIGFGLIQCVR
jgi:hypothetical protein